MVVSNYDGSLDVGVAFQLLLQNIPVRRGIITSVDPTTKVPHVWCQNINKRGHGEAQVVIDIYHGFSNDEIPLLTITPIPGVFDSWLKRVPAQVRIACGCIRVRPGPKLRARGTSNNNTPPDLVDSPGFSPPRSLSPKKDVSNNRVPPMISQLAQLRVVINTLDNKLDMILHELENA